MFERYIFSPNLFMKILAILLLPFSLPLWLFGWLKANVSRAKNAGVKVISVGNLVLGGSGKTPFVKALFELFSQKQKVFIVLRGYKRTSKGVLKVCENGEILASVSQSGDEAMEYATTLKNANVIVSERRFEGIKEACKSGATLVILDDGFRQFGIEKFDILLRPFKEPFFPFCFPSGAYRLPRILYKKANLVIGFDEIEREFDIKNKTERMFLVSGIANPSRLSPFYSQCVGVKHFADHYDFKRNELANLLEKFSATSLLVTQKDFVKLEDFGLPLSVICMKTQIPEHAKKQICDYIQKE